LNALETWSEINRAGLTATADGEALKLRPASVITPGLAAAIREHKVVLLRLARTREAAREGVERVGGAGEVYALAAEHSALSPEDRELPASRSPKGHDPMAHQDTAKARFYREVRREDEERRRRGELPPWIRVVDGGAAGGPHAIKDTPCNPAKGQDHDNRP
jgi:hypothetical protein